MAENITLNNVSTFQNDTSAVNTINNNNAAIVTAFADVLSRSGVGPNQMSSTLDMNNQQIINLPVPQSATSPARLIDLSGGSITINTATTGTSGHTVPFLDGNNTFSGTITHAITSASPPNVGYFDAGYNVSGTNASGYNNFLVSTVDTANLGSSFGNNINSLISFGGSSVQGGRQGILGQLNLTSATNGSNANRNYIGVSGLSTASSADNGTNPAASGTSAGAFFGGNFTASAGSGAIALLNATGAEFNIQMQTGSSCWAKSLAQFSSNPTDAVNGSGINTMLWLYNQSGATAKWTNGIFIDNGAGLGTFPISTTGTIFKTGAGSVANGIDFTATTFSGGSFASPGFLVSGTTGAVNIGAAGFSSGSVVLIGQTSGSLFMSTNTTGTGLVVSQPLQVGVPGTTAGSLTLAGQTSGSATISCSATGSTLQMGAGNLTVDTGGNTVTVGAMRIGNTVTPVAGGDTSHAYFMSNIGTFGIYYGSGAPTISAAQGSLYVRTDGSSTSTRLYVNTTGSNTWTNFTSAA